MPLTAELRAYLEEVRFAVLATTGKSGKIQQTVMWYVLEGDDIVMNTARGRVKSNNIEANPAVSICFPDGYRFITIQGIAQFVDDPVGAQSDIMRIGRRYSSQEDLDKMYEASWKNENRVTVRVPIDHVITNGF